MQVKNLSLLPASNAANSADTLPSNSYNLGHNSSVDLPHSYKILTEQTLNSLFPTSSDEKQLEMVRHILGPIAKGMTDEDIKKYFDEFQFLAEVWLDSYERNIFNNKTLNELLTGK